MNAQEFILSELEALKAPISLQAHPKTDSEMVEAVFSALMSKKFRKYSVPEKNQKIIKTALLENIENKEPIKISWPFGGYKLWRLEETPEADWAELFTIMYIVLWLKSVYALYPKGVLFTFWVDEVIISKMNNIPQSDLDAYQKSFASLLEFIQPWLPSNLQLEVFLERSQYKSYEDFETGLTFEMEKLNRARTADPQPLSEAAKNSIEMNVKLIPQQAADPLWREKTDLMHYAYYNLQEQQSRVRPSYTVANITAFSTFFEPNVIPIGTTKTSIAKFWVGVGALQRRGDGFIETILSPAQIEKAHAKWEPVTIKGLYGKNFKKIRVVSLMR
ncbi:MAG: hypothetical protein Q7R54_02495 [bacterium]|nr:hypothetical protein [bacterium]